MHAGAHTEGSFGGTETAIYIVSVHGCHGPRPLIANAGAYADVCVCVCIYKTPGCSVSIRDKGVR